MGVGIGVGVGVAWLVVAHPELFCRHCDVHIINHTVEREALQRAQPCPVLLELVQQTAGVRVWVRVRIRFFRIELGLGMGLGLGLGYGFGVWVWGWGSRVRTRFTRANPWKTAFQISSRFGECLQARPVRVSSRHAACVHTCRAADVVRKGRPRRGCTRLPSACP